MNTYDLNGVNPGSSTLSGGGSLLIVKMYCDKTYPWASNKNKAHGPRVQDSLRKGFILLSKNRTLLPDLGRVLASHICKLKVVGTLWSKLKLLLSGGCV